MKEIVIRGLTLLGIVVILAIYNGKTSEHEKVDAAEKARVQEENKEISEWNAKVLADSGAEIESIYVPGEYTAASKGYGGMIEVSVTVSETQITGIKIVSAEGEDGAYLSSAKEVIDRILEGQNTEVDSVSGATFSSTGIKNAVALALEKAKKSRI